MNEILDNLVNKKVNVISNGITSCCILDLVLWKQHRIYSNLRSGFIESEVDKIEFPKNHLPIIYLKKNRIGIKSDGFILHNLDKEKEDFDNTYVYERIELNNILV
jgi:hypothetical protein